MGGKGRRGGGGLMEVKYSGLIGAFSYYIMLRRVQYFGGFCGRGRGGRGW